MNGSAHVGTDFPGSWQSDPGAGGVCGPNTYTNGNPIDGTTDDALFQGEIWGNPAVCAVGGGTLEPGDYEVSLYFAEIYFGPGCPGGGGIGSRVFDIVLEGQTVLQDFDIFAGNGCAASTTQSTGGPDVRTFMIDILDGTLDIELPASVNNGKISAIEIHSAACQDADPCTADSCDAILGCVNDPIPACTATPVPTGGAPSWLLLALVAAAWRTLSRPVGAPASQR